MNHEIADDLLHIHHLLNAFSGRHPLEGSDEPQAVLLVHIRLFRTEDVGIAGRIVIDILEQKIRAPHHAHTASTAGTHFAAGRLSLSRFLFGHGLVCRFSLRRFGRGCFRLFRGRFPGSAGHHGPSAHLCRGGILLPVIVVPVVVSEGIRLIKFPVIQAEIPLEEAVFNGFHRQKQAPILTVHGDIDIAAQRRGHAKFAHHAIGQIIPHGAVVLNEIVQRQLIQPLVELSVHKVVKLDLQAVPAVSCLGHALHGAVSLGPKAHVFTDIPVNDHRAGNIFLIRGGGYKILPGSVLHPDVQCVDPVGFKKLLIVHGDAVAGGFCRL